MIKLQVPFSQRVTHEETLFYLTIEHVLVSTVHYGETNKNVMLLVHRQAHPL